jgi:ketosteroid isomerase-like protein
MSQENLEIIRQEYAAYATRDWEAFAHLSHPEIKLETLDAGTFRGLEDVIGLFEGWRAPFAEFRVEAAEVVDLDGDRVAVVERYAGRGMHGSDAEAWLEQTYARLITFKDGKIWRIQEYPSLDRALEAAGLRE